MRGRLERKSTELAEEPNGNEKGEGEGGKVVDRIGKLKLDEKMGDDGV